MMYFRKIRGILEGLILMNFWNAFAPFMPVPLTMLQTRNSAQI